MLAGMARTLRDNRGIVQIEVLEAREETVQLMTAAGFRLAQDFGPNLVFPEGLAAWSMIRKSGNRFSEKFMLNQKYQTPIDSI